MLTIGEFAQMTHLSVRTLRRYHEAGLLEPARVDPSSGYRYYDAAQIPVAQVISRLRELDVPLANVRKILLTQDPAARAALVAEHLQRLEEQLARTQAAVASLQRLLRPEPAGVAVELRQVPEQLVAAVEATVTHADVLAWYAGAMAELDTVVREPVGPAGGLYDNALFTHGRGHVLVHVPIAEPVPAVGRVRSIELPAAELAVAVHGGAHDTIDVTYGELGRWVADHALAVAGPVCETYLVGPRDTPVAAHWRTEIGWPVFRVTGAV
ncbi:MerR family transcriptional regulator [Streptomyces griseoloalbus]|uniref:MerR family transcriptional regulator n=1 Tax=Streptomyces griseoloalbus TaxID=67303 RepID=UPI0018747C5B|nr:MerR family transcriptional regulator [Streptomyces griseoloalbus]